MVVASRSIELTSVSLSGPGGRARGLAPESRGCTLSKFEPSTSNCETTDRRAPSPNRTMAMKGPTPRARPTIVSAVRPGARTVRRTASRNISLLCAMILLCVVHDESVSQAHLSTGEAGDALVVSDQHHG